jgi:NADH-quinone oxidoreductase subunit H
MTLTYILQTVVKIAIMVGFLFNVGGILTWVDRRQSAMIQDRIGPNRAVVKVFGKEFRLAGLLHPAADGVKFFFKEDFVPPRADKLLFALAPIISMVPVLVLIAVIPFGETICPSKLWAVSKDGNLLWPAVERYGMCVTDIRSGAAPIPLQVASLNVGLLFVFAFAGQSIIGAAMAGAASDNKFSLMGALRAASQMVSYEVTLGLSLIGMIMIGGIRLDEIVRWQGDNAWGIFVQPLMFFVFFAAAVAESKRIPFDLPEAESELVSGYFTEYSGMKFGMFYFAEYMEIVTSSMLIVTLFLGGWQLPFVHRDGLTIAFGEAVLVKQVIPHIWVVVISVLAFFGKVLALCWIQAFVRWSLPRFRYDQLMMLCWKVMLPLSLANIFVTGIVMLALREASPGFMGVLQVLADCTQALVAVVITYFVLRGIIGMFQPKRTERTIVGTAAARAAALGGTPEGAMQP